VEGSDVTGTRLLLGQQLARLRREAGHTQESFARAISVYTRATVADAERGRRNLSRDFWSRCDEALRADGQLAGAYDEMIVALAADALGKAADRAIPGDAQAAPDPRHTTVGIGNEYRRPALTVQRCPNCGHPLTIITLISGHPGPGPDRRPGQEHYE
jgi:transcriptional regulator with XRE-family HTH domain